MAVTEGTDREPERGAAPRYGKEGKPMMDRLRIAQVAPLYERRIEKDGATLAKHDCGR
jgi:hypothetical protein